MSLIKDTLNNVNCGSFFNLKNEMHGLNCVQRQIWGARCIINLYLVCFPNVELCDKGAQMQLKEFSHGQSFLCLSLRTSKPLYLLLSTLTSLLSLGQSLENVKNPSFFFCFRQFHSPPPLLPPTHPTPHSHSHPWSHRCFALIVDCQRR